MAISKIILNGITQIDLTQDTVSQASHILSPYIGHLNDGTQVTGTGSGGRGIETVTIFPSQTVTATDADTSGYVIYLNAITEQLIEDTNYIVTLDNVPYFCRAESLYGSVYAGDTEIVWGNPANSSYPFMLGSYANNHTQWGIADNLSHTVQIERVVSISG